MTCQEIVRTIDPYLDDELSVMETLRVQGHLIFCERCRSVLESEALLRSLVTADAARDQAPPALRQRILERARETFPETRSVAHRPRPTFPRAASPRAYLAGAVMLTLLLSALMIPGVRGPEDLPPVAAEVAAKHLLYGTGAGAALEMSTSEAPQIALWLEPRLGFSVKLPRLARPGERLLGGRVSSVVDTPAAYLLYERLGRRISLFITRPPTLARPGGTKRVVEGVELYTTALHGITLVWWEDGAHLYAAVSSAGLQELLEFALLCVRSKPLSEAGNGDGGDPS